MAPSWDWTVLLDARVQIGCYCFLPAPVPYFVTRVAVDPSGFRGLVSEKLTKKS